MKILCDSCEQAPASVICCADEAALCPICDSRVHTANKLARKHQRLPLISVTQENSVTCDICQEKRGYFFCLEDRALLCRNCDVSIHSSNALASNHRRFLLTGLRIPLHAVSTQDVQTVETPNQTQTQGATQMGSPSPSQCSVQMHGSKGKPQIEPSNFGPTSTFQEASAVATASSNVKRLSSLGPSTPSLNVKPAASVSSGSLSPEAVAASISVGMKKETTEFGHTKRIGGEGHGCKGTISDYLTEAIAGWGMDETFPFTDTASGYNFVDFGSSKADAVTLWDLDWSADLKVLEDQVPRGSFAEVPQTPSPPTATGLWRSGGLIGTTNIRPDLALLSGCTDFSLVPDIGGQLSPTSFPSQKRRKTFLQPT